ncbi:MAG: very short patch repair endonuclease [Bacteroidales bacterium]|nr:very short patch repair endonuclease [Bacteroidales bacterium]
MADKMTKEQRHKCMASIRSKNTSPEMAIRRGLHKRGYRFRIHVKSLPGTPDIVLPRHKTAILVNGCFWHGHKNCRKFVLPQSNTNFWEAKIARNIHRDEITCAHLTALGWHVITVWECEVATNSLTQAALDRIGREIAESTLLRSTRSEMREKTRTEMKMEQEEIMRRQAALEAEIDRIYPLPAKIRQLSKTALSLSDYMEEED